MNSLKSWLQNYNSDMFTDRNTEVSLPQRALINYRLCIARQSMVCLVSVKPAQSHRHSGHSNIEVTGVTIYMLH